MAHTLDVNKLPQIFEGLKENQHKLTPWECDRVEEWEELYERRGPQALSERQLELIEQWWQKV